MVYMIGVLDALYTGADTDAVTDMPRIEANIVFSGDGFSVWSSGFFQSVDSNDPAVKKFNMNGIDVGGSIAMGDLGVRANYSVTKGTGNWVVGGHGFAGGAQEESADQWYLEATFKVSPATTVGISHGEGTDDLTNEDAELAMVFSRHKITKNWTLMGELQYFDDIGGDYNAFIVGSQFNF
jgi:hypothetical protein